MINKKADGTIIDSYTYTYDAAHNQISKVDAKGTTSYTYDVLNRLETVIEPSSVKTTYTYDRAGNRETETILQGTNTTQNTYSYNEQNRLTQVTTKQNGILTTTTVYAYDNNGNQTTTTVNGAVTVNNTYDVLNQLIRTVAGGTTVENAYNGDGFRVEKKVNGALTRYLYEYDKVVLEIDGAGNQTGRNVYGSNLLMRTSDGTSYYYMYNGHADVTALLKPDGTLAATYYYDAFGNITDTTGSANNSITFAGYQYDKETGLYYLNARMYDPKTARFLQEDTYTGDPNDPLSLNLYTYCHNEPLMYDDPTGHSPLSWFKKNIVDPVGDGISTGAKWVGNKTTKVAGYVADKVEDAWDTTTSYVSEKSSDTLKAIKNGAKIVKEWGSKEINETKEGFVTLTNSKKRKEAFKTIDTYGTKSDKILARVAAGTAALAGTTAAVATAVYAAPIVATAAYSAYGAASTTALGTYLWNNPDVGLDVYNLGSDVYNNNLGNIPMDMLAFAYNGANYRAGKTSNTNIELTETQKNYNAYMANRNSTAGVSDVVPQRPTFKVSKEQYPNHAKMLENAQGNGHSLEGLEKGSGTRAAQRNRYNAQKGIRKQQGSPPEGFDYDEFPYASTKQGGAGAHVEPVPSAENQAVGRDLGQFYRKHGLKENDPYDIKITR